MANFIKGNIGFSPVVEQISSKFAIKKKTCSASQKVGPVTTEPNSWMGSGCRGAYRAGLGTMYKNFFMFRENARSSAVTEAESTARTIFAQANAWVNAAVKDLSAISHNQHIWDQLVEAPDTRYDSLLRPKGYTEVGFMRAWAIKKLTNGGELPQNHQMPAIS